MNFKDAENYLLSLGNEVSAMKLGLENIRTLLGTLGDPQKKYLKVQVAGTNGKGSVCAFLNSICIAAGIRAGMYTSPHLVSITERIQIDGVNITEEKFAEFATLVRETSEELVASGEIENIPTFFEQVTAIALLAFADARVELAILETGLGGRLDATTAANAEIAAITRIDLDHQKYLGETIEEIAAEKAAIIQESTLGVVIGRQDAVAGDIICTRAWGMGLRPMSSAKVWTKDIGPDRYEFIDRLGAVKLGLHGRHQLENAKIAIMVVEELIHMAYDKKIPSLTGDRPITIEEVVRGLESARHPGRLEWVGNFLLDGAHNVGGATALREYLDEFVTEPLTVIFGAMDDKNVVEIGRMIFPTAACLILTTPNNSRALTADQLLKSVPDDVDRGSIVLTSSAAEAVDFARALKGNTLVTGSLYLVGEVRDILFRPSPRN